MSEAHSEESCVACSMPLASEPTVRLAESRLLSCSACRTWHYYPRADGLEQIARHDAARYLDHPYFRNRRARRGRVRARCRIAFEELGRAVAPASLRGGRVLDVGCSTGEFLEVARDLYGIRPIGIDVSRDAVALLRQKGIEAHVSTIENASDDLCDFSAIVAIDVIEHVVDPVGFLRAIAARLGPGGVGYLETPNPSSTVYRLGASLSRWSRGRPTTIFERLFPPEHQHYFPSRALVAAAQLAGLDVVRVFSRRLPAADLGVSLPIKAILAATQAIDLTFGEWPLLCLTVKKR